MTPQLIDIDNLDEFTREWEEAFPYNQEYNAWIASIERDFQEEVEFRNSVKIPREKSNISVG